MAATLALALACGGLAYASDAGSVDGAGAAGQEGRTEGTDSQDGEGQTVSKENLAKAAEGVDKIILVIGDEAKSLSGVTVSYYERDYGPGKDWRQVFSVPGVYGRNGGTYEKAEGDGKTPCGTYQFTMAFGIKPDPGSKLPYTQLSDQDYWVDDSSSAYYNRFVNTSRTPKDWSSAEHLVEHSPEYDYALALNYNQAGAPGLGSAIFLHCNRDVADAGSAGCIRIPEEYMVRLIQSVDATTRIVIVTDISHLEPRTLIPEQYGRYL